MALGYEQETVPAASQCPQPKLNINTDNAAKLVGELNINTNHPVIGFMPGAEYGRDKQRPVEHFVGLAIKSGITGLRCLGVWCCQRN